MWRVLAKPLNQVQVVFKVRTVLFRKIRVGNRYAPAEAAAVGFDLLGKNLQKRGFCDAVDADESDLVIFVDDLSI